MFSFIGYVERAGSGADTITKGWNENNWPKPQIREIYDPDRVEMVLSLHGLEGNMGKDETTHKTGVETRVKTRDKLLNLLLHILTILTPIPMMLTPSKRAWLSKSSPCLLANRQ